MIGVLIITHGQLGSELIDSARIILGEDPGFKFLCLSWTKNMEQLKEIVKKAVKDADSGEGVLILTDMFGGTPTNLAIPLIKEGQVDVVTGVNLPMVLKLANLRDCTDLSCAVEMVTKKGIESIQHASVFLKKKDD